MEYLESLKSCTQCPHQCGANRVGGKQGFCKNGVNLVIGSICIHRGEEPPISGSRGICNVFFSRCNMQCVYCQNYQISENRADVAGVEMTIENIANRIIEILEEGISAVGFVSPSHYVPQVKAIIQTLRDKGRKPVIVYNTNGYDTVEAIQSLAGYVDVYLPDMKYSQPGLSERLSGVKDYPETAKRALKEMFYQKGSTVLFNDDNEAEKGLIIRHLVLPGLVENSLGVLRFIAEELSTSVYISLMAQYYPTVKVQGHPKLGRCVTTKEYSRVVEEFERLGFYRGYIQDIESPSHYLPDFFKQHPFEG